MVKSFEDLTCWQKARDLRKAISSLTQSFPKEEMFLLVDQLKRASRSATANIAEGYGRFHYKENIQFCRQSRGSLYEIKDHLILANDEGYINQSKLQELSFMLDECLATLNGYINYLKKNIEQ